MRAYAALVGVFLLAGVSDAAAQNYSGGIKAGINFSNVEFDGDGVDVNFDSRKGLIGGAFVVLPVSGAFGVQIEGLYSQKGATIEEDGGEGRIELDYIEIPVLARFSSAPGANATSFHVFAGPSFGFNIRARTEAELDGESESQDISDDVKGFDLGLVVGAGVELGRVVIDGRYTWGFTNINEDLQDDVKVHNRAFAIMAGIRF